MHGAAGDDPADVRPPGTIVRRVRIAFLVAVLMVNAVRGHPEDRSALKGHGAAGGHEDLKPAGNAIAAVRQQAVIRHADADIDRQEVHHGEAGNIRPGPEEEGYHSQNMERAEGNGGNPVHLSVLVLAAHAEVHLGLLASFYGCRNKAHRRGCDGGAASLFCSGLINNRRHSATRFWRALVRLTTKATVKCPYLCVRLL